jgi:ribonuclease P protein component
VIKRKNRLKLSGDFEHVRRTGKTFKNPLLILITAPNNFGCPRIGIAAGKRIGKAFLRNLVKRRLRASMAQFLPHIQGGWDIILIARKASSVASFLELQEALQNLLQRTGYYMTCSQQE